MNKPMSVNDTMAKYRRNFYKVYHSTIAPVFRQFEKKRRDKLINLYFINALILLFIISFLWRFFSGSMSANSNEIWVTVEFVAGVAAIVLFIFLPFHFNGKFVDELKATCMSRIISMFGQISWHDKVALIPDTDMNKSCLFSRYNRRISNDAFSGSYNGVDFKICETELMLETGSGKNRRVVSIFKGVVVKFKSNKNANGITVVASKKDPYTGVNNAAKYASFTGFIISSVQIVPSLFKDGHFDFTLLLVYIGVLGAVFLISAIIGIVAKYMNKNKLVLSEMKLEDPDFGKSYKAYSTDQVQGRYLITTAFMERFKNLQTSFGTEKAKCSFYEDEFMFAISTRRNLFEIGNLFKSLDDPKQMETFFNELTSIFLLVDYFKLNQKTGL